MNGAAPISSCSESHSCTGTTGALKLAQIGRSVEGRGPTTLLVVAFSLLATGFLIKAAAVPFHFWLADAYAVAPAPVCALLAGVMSDLGVYAIARIFWTIFAGPFAAHDESVRWILLGIGVGTGLVGGVMAFLQRHLKRMLAFATIADVGIFLIGIALLTPDGLAGVALFVIAHGLAKGSLFLTTGVLRERLDSVDELVLGARPDLPAHRGDVGSRRRSRSPVLRSSACTWGTR